MQKRRSRNTGPDRNTGLDRHKKSRKPAIRQLLEKQEQRRSTQPKPGCQSP